MAIGIATNVPRDSISSCASGAVSVTAATMSKKSGSTWFVWLVVLFGAVGGILFGMDQANFAGVETKDSFVDDFCISQDRSLSREQCRGEKGLQAPGFFTDFQAWGGSLIQLGAAAGALLLAPTITRRFGRRAGLAAGCAVVLGSMIWNVMTLNVTSFYFSRFVVGFGVGMVTFTLPMWTAELAPPEIRGILGCTMQMACVIGSQIAFGINIPASVTWQHSLIAPVFPAAVVMLFIFLFPESPRFLMQQKGAEAARKTLEKLRQTSDVNVELREIERSIENEAREAPWSVLWKDPSIRRRVIIANMLQWMQQFTGINAILGHGPKLFLKAGVPMDENTAGFVTSAFNFVGTILMMVIIDRKGRRPLLLSGAVGMLFFMVFAGILAQFFPDNTTAAWLLLVCVFILFQLFYCLGRSTVGYSIGNL